MLTARLPLQATLSAFDLYQRKLRSREPGEAQKGTQSNEDDRSVEVQTEEISTSTQEVQFQFGDDGTDFSNLVAATEGGRAANGVLEKFLSKRPHSLPAPGGLSTFLKHSTQVMTALLMEMAAGSESKETEDPQGGAASMFTSESWGPLEIPLPGTHRFIVSEGPFVLSVCALDSDGSNSLSGTSVGVLWDTLAPEHPAQLLVTDCDLTCACFKSTLVILAGSREGNLIMWDLREPNSAAGMKVRAPFPALLKMTRTRALSGTTIFAPPGITLHPLVRWLRNSDYLAKCGTPRSAHTYHLRTRKCTRRASSTSCLFLFGSRRRKGTRHSRLPPLTTEASCAFGSSASPSRCA